jgi:hypothetical protein
MAPRRSWAKADNPFWSNHVAAWYGSALDAKHYCRKHDLSTASLMRWARHLVSAEDLRKRAEDLQKSRPENAGTAAEERAVEQAQEASAQSQQRAYGQRSDSASRVLEHACVGDELERPGARRICHSARSFAPCVAHLARSDGTIRQRNGLAIPASSECPGSIMQRC